MPAFSGACLVPVAPVAPDEARQGAALKVAVGTAGVSADDGWERPEDSGQSCISLRQTKRLCRHPEVDANTHREGACGLVLV